MSKTLQVPFLSAINILSAAKQHITIYALPSPLFLNVEDYQGAHDHDLINPQISLFL